MVQIFMSHTKRDKDFCDRFWDVAPSVGVKLFRSELEILGTPPWKTIKDAIDDSVALFLLIGHELVKAQKESNHSTESRREWKYTQNWISYEIGLACQKGIDVWVQCDSGVLINFPVPYLNNYAIYGVPKDKRDEFLIEIFEEYENGKTYPIGFEKKYVYHCPHEGCGAMFNLHSFLPEGLTIICPSCLRHLHFEEGWLLKDWQERISQLRTRKSLAL
ncbi:hypothetical protein KA005_41245 [bacterium]|nr:hypothetical protein [bacterium]